MMPNQFDCPREPAMTVTRDHIVKLARSWIGTPYHHQASLKGTGTDCLGLVRGIYRSLYDSEAETAPAYSPDWGEISGEETLLAAAKRHLSSRSLSSAGPGDVLVFRIRSGAIAKHVGILTGPATMVHAAERVGVVEVPLGRWWWRRVAGVFSFPRIED